mmetsp:Transcript_44335/g.94365  ORF Transcript_44335/g.94365 Transcript_44335/m.94365 type:complete len:97 (-) Transcript_44335:751-1041(-)
MTTKSERTKSKRKTTATTTTTINPTETKQLKHRRPTKMRRACTNDDHGALTTGAESTGQWQDEGRGPNDWRRPTDNKKNDVVPENPSPPPRTSSEC